MSVEGVLWDVGNVILLADQAITHDLLVEYGVAPVRACQFYANDYYTAFGRGQLSGQEFWRELVDNVLGASLLSYVMARHAHDQHIYGADRAVLALLEMTARHRQCAIVTSCNVWQVAREKELVCLADYVPSSRIFRSNEMGRHKTDPGTFDVILEQLSWSAATTLLIDDNPDCLAAAKAAGLQTLRYTSAGELASELVGLHIV